MRAAVVALLLSATVTACIDDQLVPCGELACPIGLVCTTGGCATAEAGAACNGAADGTACTTPSVATGTCTGGACFVAACGNSVLDAGEACDDGNVAFNDGCSPDCRSTEVCGNGIPDPLRSEECDSGVEGLSSDGCTSVCTFEIEIWREAAVAQLTGRFAVGFAYDVERQRTVLFGGYDGSQNDETWEYDGQVWQQRISPTTPPIRTNHVMIYDRARRRVMMFGGESAFTVKLDDTWEWDGVTWTKLSPAVRPSPRDGAAMAYDPVRNVTVMFGGRDITNTGLAETWEWDGTNWTPRTSVATPPARRVFASMAFDPVLGKILLFGGFSTGPTAEVWTWDGLTWAPLSPAGPVPGGRFGAVLATDGSQIMMYGGQNQISGGFFDDVWIWNGSAWSGPTVGPSPRAHARLVFDDARDRFVLFGGSAPGSIRHDETWELTGTSWTQNVITWRPSARLDHGLAYDARRGRIVAFGGRDDSSRNNETWEWDGVGWLQRRPAASPPKRTQSQLVYDTKRGRTLLFGGATPTREDDLWSWDGTQWLDISPPSSPAARDGHGLAYDRARDRVVMFGGTGLDGTKRDDTWELDGTEWKQVAIGGPAPSPRRGGTLVYDAHRRRTVLVGGQDAADDILDDLWEWDGVTWTQVGTLAPLVPRARVGLAYDPLRQLVAGFGGQTFLSYAVGQTLEWDGATLALRLPPLEPSRRSGTALAYDAIRHAVVMLDGQQDNTILDETWLRRYESAGHPPEGCVRATDDTDGDGLAGCADADCYGRCTPLCLPGEVCDPADPHCDDGVCGPVEDHLICPADCSAP